MRTLLAVLMTLGVSLGQVVEVPNPSFENGTTGPDGWRLSGGQGDWLNEGADGQRAIAVTGTGQGTNYWRSAPLALRPSALYRVRFRAKSLGGAGGCVITGPSFANYDRGGLPAEWAWYSQVFATPREVTPDSAWLRFGQWEVSGQTAFDQIGLTAVQPIHTTQGDLVLGEGESLRGNTYVFDAPIGSGVNHSRPQESYTCSYNSSRYVFGQGGEVVYRQEVGGRLQSAGKISANIGWYAGGELLVEASKDQQNWVALGTRGALGELTATLPAALLPAKVIWVRLKSQAKQKLGTESDPGAFQVYSYHYEATVDGAPLELTGRTRYVAVPTVDPKVAVRLTDLGEGLPGGRNLIRGTVRNDSGQAVEAAATVTVQRPGEEAKPVPQAQLKLPPGESAFEVPYQVPGTGLYVLTFALSGGVRFGAESELNVAELYNSSYGEKLPGSSNAVGVWWCDSGWKVSRTRPVPSAAGAAVKLSLARNEAEAAQVVVRPAQPLRGFQARAQSLVGPGRAIIDADFIDVLRVRYLNVVHPTDQTSVAAPWPDPLPPFSSLDLAAGENQPLWLRVTTRRNTPAGIYRGLLRLTAENWRQDVPIEVKVYDFALPDTMSCATAFGFNPWIAFRYHKVTDERQQRQLLDKYLATYASHHISPYNPAPLDPFKVTWPGLGRWAGGTRDQSQPHEGRTTLKVDDTSPTASVAASYQDALKIPPQGLRLRFWYKTGQPGHRFIVTLGHKDAAGNWMSGRNNDMPVEGNGQWQQFDRTVTSFPPGAVQVTLGLWATLWTEKGEATGTVWYDQVSLTDAGSGAELLRDSSFEPLKLDQLKPQIDWRNWDAAMTRAFDTYHFNSFVVPIEGISGPFLGFAEGTLEHNAAFTAYAQAIERHLVEKGWIDKSYVYWTDEPEEKDYPWVLKGFLKLKAAAPRIGRMLTEQPEAGLFGGPNIWCPVTPNYDPKRAAEREQAGEKFWWYVCTGPKAPFCTLFIDHPGTELRTWLWQTWERNIKGVLIWETTWWHSDSAYPDAQHPQNPYEDPMGWVPGLPAGTKQGWGNGDGRFVYPAEAAADGNPSRPVLDGPVDSIRFEMLRDGVEDYEYLVMCRKLLREEGWKKLSKHRVREIGELLKVPADISRSMTEFTKDPAPILARRAAVAAAIEEISRP